MDIDTLSISTMQKLSHSSKCTMITKEAKAELLCSHNIYWGADICLQMTELWGLHYMVHNDVPIRLLAESSHVAPLKKKKSNWKGKKNAFTKPNGSFQLEQIRAWLLRYTHVDCSDPADTSVWPELLNE